MKQEDKELLLKDLCARLPYGVKVSKVVEDWTSGPHPIRSINLNNIIVEDGEFEDGTPDIDIWDYEDIKPYLFPLSSMTEEQKQYISDRWGINEAFDFEIDPDWGKYFVDLGDAVGFVDWLNEKGFDYRGLIPKDLAIDATEQNVY